MKKRNDFFFFFFLLCFMKECQPVAICTFVNGVWLLNVKWARAKKQPAVELLTKLKAYSRCSGQQI